MKGACRPLEPPAQCTLLPPSPPEMGSRASLLALQVFKKDGLKPVFKYNPFKRDLKKLAAQLMPGQKVHMRKAAVEMIRDMVEARLLRIYEFANIMSIEVGGMKTLKTKTFNISAARALRDHQEPCQAWATVFNPK